MMKTLLMTVLATSLLFMGTSTLSFAADVDNKKPAKTIDVNVTKEAKINVNKASLDELQVLKGIGAAKAQAIIDYRNKNGKFKSLQQLTMVSGVGEKLISQNASSISF